MKLNKIINFLICLNFVLSFLITIILCFKFIQGSSGLDFDSQNIHTWKLVASQGLIPYKDVFFPYGIFFYYIYDSVLFQIAFFITSLGSLAMLGYITARIFNNKRVGLVFIALLSCALLYSGIYSFLRYGLALVLLLYVPFYFSKSKLDRLKGFLLGIGSGLLFSFFLDQGFYFFIILIIGLIIYVIEVGTFKSFNKNNNVLFSILFIIAGFLIGLLPLIIYLLEKNSLQSFISYFADISDISLYAKTPYLHSLRNLTSVFNILVLVGSVLYLSYSRIILKIKTTRQSYAIFLVCLYLLILEQKSIVRNIDNQLFFIAAFVFIIVLYCLLKRFSNDLSKVLIYTLVIGSTFFLFYNLTIFYASTPLKRTNLDLYIKTVEKIEKRKKILSIPGDPIFYSIQGQKPPYYFNIYDSSSKKGQQQIIDYIKDENVEYVIFNKNIKAIQDAVPDYVRVPLEYSYIFSNFEYNNEFGNFIILKKSRNSDFFKSGYFINDKELNEYFLSVNLGMVPASEGLYKYNKVTKDSIAKFNNLDKLNNYLKNNISSKDLFLAIFLSREIEKFRIKVYSNDGIVSTVEMNGCIKNSPCLINLSRLPIFYKYRIVTKVEINPKLLEKVILVKSNNTILW